MTALLSSDDQRFSDAQRAFVVGPSQQPTTRDASTKEGSLVADALLLIYADALDDIERVRIANENRVRSLRDVKGMSDTPEERRLAAIVESMRALEHGVELELKRALRMHPLGPWIKRTVGVGEKQGARLLAAIGDPASRRTVSQLWAYCGYHVLPVDQRSFGTQVDRVDGDISDLDHRSFDAPTSRVEVSHSGHGARDAQSTSAGVAPSRKRGHKANWNATAKMRAFLVAESCIKQAASPYRSVYDNGRLKYTDAVHGGECKRCGPAGHPATVGSPLSLGHQHARALRLVAKEILRDLWVEARRVA